MCVPGTHFRRDPAPHPLPQRLARGINPVIGKKRKAEYKACNHETFPNSILVRRRLPLPLPLPIAISIL